jgi:hypothetical protein
MNQDDQYPNFGLTEKLDDCRYCAQPLLPRNLRIADGCPCNAPRGVNHGLVPKNTCTCVLCDPAQIGSTRIGSTDKITDADVGTEWSHYGEFSTCRIERVWRIDSGRVVVEFLRDDAMRTSNLNEPEFCATYIRKLLPKEQYPDGKIVNDDEGALQIAIGIDKGVVVLFFGKPTSWIGLDVTTGRSLCQALSAKVEELAARSKAVD